MNHPNIPVFADLEIISESRAKTIEECVSGVDFVGMITSKKKRTNVVAVDINPIGLHRVCKTMFAPENDNGKTVEQKYVARRSGHTRKRGVRMHMCALHNVSCKRSELVRNDSKCCLNCDHPIRCRMALCKRYGKELDMILSKNGLYPLACELPISWYHSDDVIATRVDLVCTRRKYLLNTKKWNSQKIPPLTVVSLKTLGKTQETPRYVRANSQNSSSILSKVFGESISHSERNIYEAQLMMECAILSDSYTGIEVEDCKIVYIRDSKSRGTTRTVNAQEMFWWEKFKKDPSRLGSLIYRYLPIHIKKL